MSQITPALDITYDYGLNSMRASYYEHSNHNSILFKFRYIKGYGEPVVVIEFIDLKIASPTADIMLEVTKVAAKYAKHLLLCMKLREKDLENFV